MTPETPGAAAAADTGSSIYDSGASNLDILESVGNSLIDESSPAAGGSGTGVTDPAAPGASGTEGGAAGEQPARPEWYETAPAELKGLLDHGNVSAPMKKWLEETYGELNGFKSSPIGSREAVQEITELFPGGVEDMRVAHEQSQAFAREMEQFRSGDATQQSELLAGLLQDEAGPEAFISLTSNALELLKETLPRDYTAVASGITKGHLDEVTDGKFSSFFDSVRGVASEYQAKLDAGDHEGAAKLAAKLGGYALQMSDWWGTAKNKLGYGEQAAATPGARPSLVPNRGVDLNDKDVQYAQRDAQYFNTNYISKHDSLVRPMVTSNLTKELTARKMELTDKWKNDIMSFVENGIKQNLIKDKTFAALEARIYKRNSADPRRWDNSEKVAQILLNNVKSRAEKLVPVLLKQALDRLSELRPGTQRQVQPGEKIRTGAGGPGAGGGGGNSWEADLKDGKISSVDAIQKMAGLN
jgi:hypothetical protein